MEREPLDEQLAPEIGDTLDIEGKFDVPVIEQVDFDRLNAGLGLDQNFDSPRASLEAKISQQLKTKFQQAHDEFVAQQEKSYRMEMSAMGEVMGREIGRLCKQHEKQKQIELQVLREAERKLHQENLVEEKKQQETLMQRELQRIRDVERISYEEKLSKEIQQLKAEFAKQKPKTDSKNITVETAKKKDTNSSIKIEKQPSDTKPAVKRTLSGMAWQYTPKDGPQAPIILLDDSVRIYLQLSTLETPDSPELVFNVQGSSGISLGEVFDNFIHSKISLRKLKINFEGTSDEPITWKFYRKSSLGLKRKELNPHTSLANNQIKDMSMVIAVQCAE